MSLNVEDIRRRQREQIEELHQEEVREEDNAIRAIEDLAQEMEDRGEPDGEVQEARSEGLIQQLRETDENREAYTGATESNIRRIVNEVLDESDTDFEEVMEEMEEMEREAVDVPVNPPNTVQDVRDAVAEGTRIDVSDIPLGVSPEEFVEQFQRTGQLITDSTPTTSVTVTNTSTGTTYVDMEATTTDGTTTSLEQTTLDAELAGTIDRLIETGDVKVDPENGATVMIGDTPPESETPKQVRARQRKANPKGYAEDAKYILLEKRAKNIANIEKKRETFLSKLQIGPQDIAINIKGEMFHTTIDGETHTVHAEHALIFDKSFNLLAPDGDPRKVRRSLRLSRTSPSPRKKRIGTRVNRRSFFSAGHGANPVVKKYLILDKGVLITSGGGRFKIKVKNNVKISELLGLKKKFQETIRSMHEAIEHVVAGVGAVLPPEDFEVIYELGSLISYNTMSVLLRFRDVTITNAIETSRYLGDMVLKLDVEHYPNNNGLVNLIFRSGVHGQRITYTATDAVAGYTHSHITSGINQSFQGFCTGNQNYSLENPNVMEIEAHVYRLKEFVSWESLEGGPHYRMENVNPIGTSHRMSGRGNMKTLPNAIYIEKMLAHINGTEGGFDSLSHCFRLVNKAERLVFTVDRKRFYLQVMELFDNTTLETLSRSNRDRKYFYRPERDQFYKLSTRGISNPTQLRQQALDTVMNTIPIYMNGRYIKPKLIEESDPFEGIRLCPSPELMYELINVIMYHLTEKLEKYGNTSERQEG